MDLMNRVCIIMNDFMVMNVPGSVHDSSIASTFNVYRRLEEKFHETGGRCIVDST
jgi:hypothetical protein